MGVPESNHPTSLAGAEGADRKRPEVSRIWASHDGRCSIPSSRSGVWVRSVCGDARNTSGAWFLAVLRGANGSLSALQGIRPVGRTTAKMVSATPRTGGYLADETAT